MGASLWEEHWKLYRVNRHLSYTIGQAGLFLVLGLLSAGLPVLLAIAYDLKLAWNMPAKVVAWFLVAYVALIVAMAFCNFLYSEQKIEDRWREVLKRQKSG
jgi:hypothetical protein